jgi:hypothetical protein
MRLLAPVLALVLGRLALTFFGFARPISEDVADGRRKRLPHHKISSLRVGWAGAFACQEVPLPPREVSHDQT